MTRILFLSLLGALALGCVDLEGDDASLPDGSTADGSAADGSAPDGSAPDGSAADASIPEHCADGPLDAPIPDCTLALEPTTGDIRQDCVNRINQFRMECQCLPPLERWRDGEECADQHAEYDHDRGTAHGGFNDGICTPGGRAQNECPGWRSNEQIVTGCLQQMWDEGPGEPFSAHGHYINMSSSRYGRVACGFYEGGGIWAVQNFAP